MQHRARGQIVQQQRVGHLGCLKEDERLEGAQRLGWRTHSFGSHKRVADGRLQLGNVASQPQAAGIGKRSHQRRVPDEEDAKPTRQLQHKATNNRVRAARQRSRHAARTAESAAAHAHATKHPHHKVGTEGAQLPPQVAHVLTGLGDRRRGALGTARDVAEPGLVHAQQRLLQAPHNGAENSCQRLLACCVRALQRGGKHRGGLTGQRRQDRRGDVQMHLLQQPHQAKVPELRRRGCGGHLLGLASRR
mmetsp:Transcript_4577/g.14089  ORF Transcript_4577/g.14089 Transcript_4577/m.14089 type:complete len:248 (-) Transcript_4577:564-1307(-)